MSTLKTLMQKTKAELFSFGASSALGLLAAGLQMGAPLVQASPNPVIAAAGDIASAAGQAIATVAVPAAGATFINAVTAFGKAWRDMNKTRNKAPGGHSQGSARPGQQRRPLMLLQNEECMAGGCV